MDITLLIKRVLLLTKHKTDIVWLRYEYFQQQLSKRNKVHYCFFCLTFVAIFCVSFILNHKTHLTGDDFVYSYIFHSSQRVTSVSDILNSQYLHYKGWGGRSVVHFIAQFLLLMCNPLVLDLLNSLVFVLLVYLIYIHVLGSMRCSISLLFTIFALLWISQPAFAETTLWITGSANYLWGASLILSFLLPYRLYKGSTGSSMKRWAMFALMLILGILAGWTNENTSAGMISIIFLFALYYKYMKWRIPVWIYSGLLGSIIGYIVMILAPGNFVRASGVGFSLFHILYRTLPTTQNLVNYVGFLNLGIAVLLVLYVHFNKVKELKLIYLLLMYFIGFFISVYIMVASPAFPARAWFGPIVFNIIVFGIILNSMDYSLTCFRQIKACLLVYCLMAFSFNFYDAYNDVSAIDRIWKDRERVIEIKKEEGAASVSFPQYHAKTKFGLGDAPYALEYISLYYGIEFQLEQ